LAQDGSPGLHRSHGYAGSLFDEPTTGQDATSIQRIGQIVDILAERGKTIITITHDIDFAADHFERLIAMSQGQILLDGPTIDVIANEEQLASAYVDPPQLTRLSHRLGIHQTVCNQANLLETYRSWREQR
jgi:energy-coupling factor transport system ATP-binding protein